MQLLTDTAGQAFVLATSPSADTAGLAAWRLVGDTALTWLGWQVLETSPLRHPGGFQVQGQQLVVGIEDNAERTRSDLVFYTWVGKPDSLVLETARVHREGAYERATAGAVAYGDCSFPWVVVGSWDCHSLDLYPLAPAGLPRHPRQPLDSLRYALQHLPINNPGPADQPAWSAYQNLNLLTLNQRVYLVGLGKVGKTDVLDVYRLQVGRGLPPGLPGWWVPLWRIPLASPPGAKHHGGAGLRIDGDYLEVWAAPNEPGPGNQALRWRVKKRAY